MADLLLDDLAANMGAAPRRAKRNLFRQATNPGKGTAVR